MLFIFNALENGWQIAKKSNKYIFIKKYDNNNELNIEAHVDNYLHEFVQQNLNARVDINNIN
jgi:hypothetical protein